MPPYLCQHRPGQLLGKNIKLLEHFVKHKPLISGEFNIVLKLKMKYNIYLRPTCKGFLDPLAKNMAAAKAP